MVKEESLAQHWKDNCIMYQQKRLNPFQDAIQLADPEINTLIEPFIQTFDDHRKHNQRLQSMMMINQNEDIDEYFNHNDLRYISNIQEMYEELESRLPQINKQLKKLQQKPKPCYQVKVFIAKEKQDCSICLNELAKYSKVATISCNHQFHKQCIDKWLEVKKQCPNCKKDL